jgi:hypothetical protein
LFVGFFFARSEKGGLKKKTNKQKLNKNLKKKVPFPVPMEIYWTLAKSGRCVREGIEASAPCVWLCFPT